MHQTTSQFMLVDEEDVCAENPERNHYVQFRMEENPDEAKTGIFYHTSDIGLFGEPSDLYIIFDTDTSRHRVYWDQESS